MNNQRLLELRGICRSGGSPLPSSRPEPVRRDLSATSVTAARAAAKSADGLRARIREYLRQQGTAGATDLEIEAAFPGVRSSSLRGRRRELEVRGLVRDSGSRRRSPAGRDAIVWVTDCERQVFDGG